MHREDSRRRPVHCGEVDLGREVPGERLRLLDVVVDLLLQHLPPNVLRLQFGLLQLLQEVRLERWEFTNQCSARSGILSWYLLRRGVLHLLLGPLELVAEMILFLQGMHPLLQMHLQSLVGFWKGRNYPGQSP